MISAVVVFIFFIVTSSAHQLRVNAPQVPQFTYATGEGSPATVGATVVGLYAFTADAYSVWGLNIDIPANEQVPFQDSLFGVTQIWGWCGSQGNLNTCRLHVIAGPTLVMYKMNETTVWRAATFTVTNATFNMMSDGTLTAMSPPVVLPYGSGSGSLFVIGTGTVPFFALRASIVYAFDVQSLEIVWTTSLSSDASNFMTKNCSDFVWITTFANSNLTATIVLRKVDWRTGALQDWSFDTQIPQFLELSVAGGQFMALSPFGHVTYGFYNGTSILVDYILSDSCTISIPPALIGMMWYVICGTNVLTWDAQSTVQLPPQTFWNVMCGTVGGGGIVFVTGNAVFLGDDTGNITNVFSISTPATCTGASFSVSNTDVVYLSFGSYPSAGNVIALNYATSEILFQAAANVIPYGPAIEIAPHKIIIASNVANHEGNILQGYSSASLETTLSYSADLSSYSGETEEYSLLYDSANHVTYYFTSTSLIAIDANGTVSQVGNFVDKICLSIPPLVVGTYLVFYDYYSSLLQWFNTVDHTIHKTTAMLATAPPYLFNISETKVVALTNLGGNAEVAAYVVDMTKPLSPPEVIPAVSWHFAGGAIMNKKDKDAVGDLASVLLINVGLSSLYGYNTTCDSFATPLFQVTGETDGFSIIQSAPVAHGNLAYFIAVVANSSTSSYHQAGVFRVTLTGGVSLLGPLSCCWNGVLYAPQKLMLGSGGAFTQTALIVMDNQNISAYSLDGKLLFAYQSPEAPVGYVPNMPTVLSATGSICFFTEAELFVVNAVSGELAWKKNTSNNNNPVFTDGTNIYFTDGEYVVGADANSGTVVSLSTFGGDSVSEFTVATTTHTNANNKSNDITTTVVIGATYAPYVFALGV